MNSRPSIQMKSLSIIAFLLSIALFSAACSTQEDTVRFMVTGDSRGSYGGTAVNSGILTEIAQAAVAEEVDFILFSGDLVWGYPSMGTLEEQLQVWLTAMQPAYDAGINVYPCRGNHELAQDTPDGAAWNAVFSGDYALPENGPQGEKGLTYSFAFDNVFVAVLDQYFEGEATHRVNQEWLDKQLAANDQPHVFVVGHEPAFKAKHEDCLDNNTSARNTFWNSIAEAGGRTYFCAHDHFYAHARIDDNDNNPDNDVHQFIVATAGASFYEDFEYNGSNAPFNPVDVYHEFNRYGYVIVEVTGKQATITWKHRSLPGVYITGNDVFSYTVDSP